MKQKIFHLTTLIIVGAFALTGCGSDAAASDPLTAKITGTMRGYLRGFNIPDIKVIDSYLCEKLKLSSSPYFSTSRMMMILNASHQKNGNLQLTKLTILQRSATSVNTQVTVQSTRTPSPSSSVAPSRVKRETTRVRFKKINNSWKICMIDDKISTTYS